MKNILFALLYGGAITAIGFFLIMTTPDLPSDVEVFLQALVGAGGLILGCNLIYSLRAKRKPRRQLS